MDSAKILIVEDEILSAHDLEGILENRGYSVSGVVGNGEDAIKKAAATRPDLVLMDITLQGDIDGVSAAAMIRERLSIPVVFLTAHSDKSTSERANTSEPYGYLLKPIDVNTLFLTIELAIYKHRLDEKLRESERRLRRITDNMLGMVNQVDLKGNLQYMSPSVKTVLGYNPDELLGTSAFDLIHPDDAQRLKSEFSTAHNRKSTANIEFRCRHADGHYVWVETMGNSIFDEQGRPAGRVYGAREITGQKYIENELRANEKRYRELFDNANDIIYTHDLAGYFTSFNRKAMDVSGYSRAEGLTLNIRQIVAPEYLKTSYAAIERMLGGEPSILFDLEIITKEGRRVPLELASSIVYHDGVAVGVQGIARDITEQRRIMEALRLSEEKFSRVFHSSPGAVTLTSLGDARFIDVNESFVRQIGYSREELIGRTVEDIQLLENPSDMEVIRGALMTNGSIRGMELRFRTRRGEIITGLYSADIITIENVSYVLTIVIDITGRKRAEEQLKSALAEKELLMKEVLHRVKNNMSVIYSLLGYQSNYLTDPKALSVFDESRNRILTMMKVNEMLYQSGDFTRVDLNRYITDLTTSLFNSYNIRQEKITLSLKIDPLPLDIQRAVPCGLIINEIITNSLKHAFSGSRSGVIHVEFRHTESGDDGRSCRLVLRDNGTGLPENIDWRNTSSMGIQLVNLLVEQLGGSIELDRSCGTEYTIDF